MPKTFPAILLVLLLSAFLAACGAPPVPTTAPPPATPTQPAPAGEPAQPTIPAELLGDWEWVGFSDPTNGPQTISEPEKYVLSLQAEGQVLVKADCKQAQGQFTADQGTLTIELGPTTAIFCGEGSRSEDFLKYLSMAATYQVEEDQLLIGLKADSGSMTFQRATAAGSGDESGPDAALPPEVVEGLDALLQGTIFTDETDFSESMPGLILLVDTPQGRYLKAAGVANMEDQTPMKEDDILEIGSITKIFTMVVLMQLQEEGVLSLDDPLSQWLPDWAEKIPYGDQMTLRHLANHTSGIWDYGDLILDAGVDDENLRRKHFTPEELVQYALDNGQPDFKPGEEGQWHYSNTGYVLLGMVIEKASGQSLGDLIQERILDPLHLTTASFIEDIPTENQLTSHGYAVTSDGKIVDTTDWNASQAWAAGALAMNAADLLTFARAFAAGELFQNPDTLAAMLDFNPNALGGLIPYGLGVMDFSQAEGGEGFFGHSGETAGFNSLLAVNPDQAVTLVALGNAKGFSATDLLDVLALLNPGD
jgi:D-alanyl-D-alanine carboxypeptidase